MEPTISPISTPELAREYPLLMITGARDSDFWHSQYRNIDKLKKRRPEPVADLHPDTAKKYGITDGDMIIVSTKTGSVEIKAKVTTGIMPSVVNIPHAWPEASGNMLTDDLPVDPVLGYPAFTGLLCRIRKKA
jgi:anaerobic selenocysteine-containing dehydrogenase